jgi:S-adenosylmethionine decarboxylase proenzyme
MQKALQKTCTITENRQEEKTFTKILGKHIIAELHGCPFDVLNNKKLVENTVVEAVKAAKMHIVSLHTHAFKPQGVSSIAVVLESHVSIHTWPEYNYAGVDIFTCGKEDPRVAYEVFLKNLKPQNASVMEFHRGIGVPLLK